MPSVTTRPSRASACVASRRSNGSGVVVFLFPKTIHFAQVTHDGSSISGITAWNLAGRLPRQTRQLSSAASQPCLRVCLAKTGLVVGRRTHCLVSLNAESPFPPNRIISFAPLFQYVSSSDLEILGKLANVDGSYRVVTAENAAISSHAQEARQHCVHPCPSKVQRRREPSTTAPAEGPPRQHSCVTPNITEFCDGDRHAVNMFLNFVVDFGLECLGDNRINVRRASRNTDICNFLIVGCPWLVKKAVVLTVKHDLHGR